MPRGGIARQRAGGLETVEVGHHHIHQHQIRQLGPGCFHARRAIGRGEDLMPQLLDDALYAQQLRRRVVDDQDACHGVPRMMPTV